MLQVTCLLTAESFFDLFIIDVIIIIGVQMKKLA